MSYLGAAPTPDPAWQQAELNETFLGVDARPNALVFGVGRPLLRLVHMLRRLFRPQYITRYSRIG